jgi:hypothetical protein
MEMAPGRGRRCGVLGVFIPRASAHLVDRAAQFIVEGAPRPGIVAQAVEFILDALGFGIQRAQVTARRFL